MLTEELENILKGATLLGRIWLNTTGTTVEPEEGLMTKEQLLMLVGSFRLADAYLHIEPNTRWSGASAIYFTVETGTVGQDIKALGLGNLGIKESFYLLDDGTIEGESAQFCLVTGNHKGSRVTTVWLLKDTLKF